MQVSPVMSQEPFVVTEGRCRREGLDAPLLALRCRDRVQALKMGLKGPRKETGPRSQTARDGCGKNWGAHLVLEQHGLGVPPTCTGEDPWVTYSRPFGPPYTQSHIQGFDQPRVM